MIIVSYKEGLVATPIIFIILLVTGCQQPVTNSVSPGTGTEQVVTMPQFSDEKIRQQVGEVLKTANNKAQIRIEVKNGLVALKGEVPSLEDRMRLVEAAKSVPGVRAIVRYIDVKPPERPIAVIEKDIRDALKSNAATRDINPAVSVKAGIVSFGGTGSDWQVKHLARRLVEKVKGVREVLTPLCFPYEGSSNSDVKKEIVDRLAISRPDFEHVSLEVENGHVLLRGRVSSLQNKLRAISVAYVDRVRSVSSHELLVDKTTGTVAELPDVDVKKVIELAFTHDPRVAPSKPQLAVLNGVVTLSGSALDLEATSIAGMLAEQIPGVKEVVNKLTVLADPQSSDSELTASLHDAFLSDPDVDVFQMQVSVDHGRALLRGNTNTMREKWKAEEIAMCTRGIVAINNQLNVLDAPEPVIISYTYFPSWEFTDLWWMIPVRDSKVSEELQAGVERQLTWSPFIDPSGITVRVEQDSVTLNGAAHSELERKAAENAAYEAGAPTVKNHLVVLGKDAAVTASAEFH